MKSQTLKKMFLVAFVLGWAASATFANDVPGEFTLADAKRVLNAAVEDALRNNAGGAIAIVDQGGHLLCLERIDGTFAAASRVATGKARTAALFQKPTKVFEELVVAKGRTSMVALEDFTPLQGGVPLYKDGRFVGAIGVSGANSAQQDEEIATAAARVLETTVSAAPSAVTFLDAVEVAGAFAKGAPLVEVEAYKVHASRREGPGRAEIHSLDTDIIYVLEGEATFVTGGSIVGAETTAPNEIRGDAIEEGQTRRLKKGDLMIVPDGTPHWFREVSGPFLYYVVKVTRKGGDLR